MYLDQIIKQSTSNRYCHEIRHACISAATLKNDSFKIENHHFSFRWKTNQNGRAFIFLLIYFIRRNKKKNKTNLGVPQCVKYICNFDWNEKWTEIVSIVVDLCYVWNLTTEQQQKLFVIEFYWKWKWNWKWWNTFSFSKKSNSSEFKDEII